MEQIQFACSLLGASREKGQIYSFTLIAAYTEAKGYGVHCVCVIGLTLQESFCLHFACCRQSNARRRRDIVGIRNIEHRNYASLYEARRLHRCWAEHWA